jgi:hypothetical protein
MHTTADSKETNHMHSTADSKETNHMHSTADGKETSHVQNSVLMVKKPAMLPPQYWSFVNPHISITNTTKLNSTHISINHFIILLLSKSCKAHIIF